MLRNRRNLQTGSHLLTCRAKLETKYPQEFTTFWKTKNPPITSFDPEEEEEMLFDATALGQPRADTMTVPRDAEGKPLLPLHVKGCVVLNLGRIEWKRKNFHNRTYIWPIGMKSPLNLRCRIQDRANHGIHPGSQEEGHLCERNYRRGVGTPL